MLNNQPSITLGEGGQVPEGTQVAGGVTPDAGAQVVTPTQTSGDAENWQVKFAELEQRYQRDINAQKSSLQRQAAEEQKRLQQQFEDKLAELQMNSMNPEQKASYSKQLEQRKVEQLQQELNQYKQFAAEQVQMNENVNWLMQMGVPREAIDTSRGVSGVSESGWNWLISERQRLMGTTAGTTPPVQPPTQTPVQQKVAPTTAVTSPGVPGKMTWHDLIQRYGSVDNVYALIEQRRLSPNILPE